jgi:hypothetical protein
MASEFQSAHAFPAAFVAAQFSILSKNGDRASFVVARSSRPTDAGNFRRLPRVVRPVGAKSEMGVQNG